jgi:hypothetical protein
MKLTAEDYRRHYHDLSDGELLAIRREDLVDAAQRAYDAEIAERQLTESSEDEVEAGDTPRQPQEDSDLPPLVPEMPPDESTVQVALLLDSATSRYSLHTLWKAQIPAMLTEAPESSGSYAANCFGLLVPESCADAARDLLASYLTWNNKMLVRMWLEKDWTPDDLELKDFEAVVNDHFGEDNKVAARLTVRGVDPATRRKVERSGIAIIHVVDGNIGDRWIRLDP